MTAAMVSPDYLLRHVGKIGPGATALWSDKLGQPESMRVTL